MQPLNTRTRRRGEAYFFTAACIFLLLQPLVFPSKPPDEGALFSYDLITNYVASLLLIAFAAVNYYLLIPRLYFRRQYIAYWLVIAAALLLVILLPCAVPSGPPPGPGAPPHVFGPGPDGPPDPLPGESLFRRYQLFFADIDHEVFLFSAIVFCSLLLKVRERWNAAERERRETEMHYLRAQVNPHFMFNSLNTVYALAIRERATQSARAALLLSGLMRYVVTESRARFVPLRSELEYLRGYVDFQRLRLAPHIPLECAIQETVSNVEIAPLLLLAFVENAFKHGVNPDEASELHISVTEDEGLLRMEVRNRIVPLRRDPADDSGTGIANVRARLELLYAGRYTLDISQSDYYQVNLTLRC